MLFISPSRGLVSLARIYKSMLVMKVAEYIPKYGLLVNPEHTISFDGTILPVNELLNNHPELELTDDHVSQLDTIDHSTLHHGLKHIFVNNQIIIAILQHLLDLYIQRGGDPFTWLSATYQKVHDNPQNFSAELRSTIEVYLLRMINCLGFPLPTPSIDSLISQTVKTPSVKAKQTSFNNLLEAFNNVSEYQKVMRFQLV